MAPLESLRHNLDPVIARSGPLDGTRVEVADPDLSLTATPGRTFGDVPTCIPCLKPN